jgi:hypothetical protein
MTVCGRNSHCGPQTSDIGTIFIASLIDCRHWEMPQISTVMEQGNRTHSHMVLVGTMKRRTTTEKWH